MTKYKWHVAKWERRALGCLLLLCVTLSIFALVDYFPLQRSYFEPVRLINMIVDDGQLIGLSISLALFLILLIRIAIPRRQAPYAAKIVRPGERVKADHGWVYVLSNRAMPNCYKVGYTSKDPHERARQLSGHTGVAAPFVVRHAVQSKYGKKIERQVHRRLGEFRTNKRREFFAVSLSKIKYEITQAEKDVNQTVKRA